MATTEKVRIAVVGMGIGKPNGLALSANPRGQVVALCDLLEDRMQEFAKALPEEVKFYTDYKTDVQRPGNRCRLCRNTESMARACCVGGCTKREACYGDQAARRLRSSSEEASR